MQIKKITIFGGYGKSGERDKVEKVTFKMGHSPLYRIRMTLFLFDAGKSITGQPVFSIQLDFHLV